MKSILIISLVSLFSYTSFAVSDYENGMLKGLEMLKNANSLQASMDVVNYFERVAEANKAEWLPLYYAAYASLSVGFQQEKVEKKDEWYQKGLAFVKKAELIKENESELLAMEGYLTLMYISNDAMKRAPLQTRNAIGLLEKAKALNPNNPRPWFIHGQNTFYTPEFYGGGATNAKPLLEKAKVLYESFKPENNLMPVWGKERCESLLKEKE